MAGMIGTKEFEALFAVYFGKYIANYITPYGGLIVWYLAGEDLFEGECVYISATNTVKKNPVNSDAPIGLVYASKNVGELVAIVVAGRGYALPESGVTGTAGYILYSSNAEAGRFDQSASIPGTTEHWREYGHVVETGSGAGVKVLVEIHKN